MPVPDTVLEIADESHLDILLPLVRAYHQFEQVEMSEDQRAAAVRPLLQKGSPLGCIWLVRHRGEVVGYGALCYGYTIEFRGRDAFVDELFIVEAARGEGLGSRVLGLMKAAAARLGIVALHLEVARANTQARRFYEKSGFRARERYFLMSCDIASAE
jgi:GNAT superfamily N-acetyltransferase